AIPPGLKRRADRFCPRPPSHTRAKPVAPGHSRFAAIQWPVAGFVAGSPYYRLSVNIPFSYIALPQRIKYQGISTKINLLMKSFFKIFLASLLALVVFSVIAFFVFLGFVSALTSEKEAET